MLLKRAKSNKREIDMTPMIDCVFLLLIFFLVATQIKESETQVRLKLPKSVEALIQEIDKPMPITVNIVAKERGETGIGLRPFWVKGRALTLEELGRVLKEVAKYQFETKGEQSTVRIRADRFSELQQLQAALKACQETKILRVFIAAEKVRAM